MELSGFKMTNAIITNNGPVVGVVVGISYGS